MSSDIDKWSETRRELTLLTSVSSARPEWLKPLSPEAGAMFAEALGDSPIDKLAQDTPRTDAFIAAQQSEALLTTNDVPRLVRLASEHRRALEEHARQLERELADAYRLAVEPAKAIAALESKPSSDVATHVHRCMSCGERWFCPHPPSDCKAGENAFPSVTLRGPDGPTVFHHACRVKK